MMVPGTDRWRPRTAMDPLAATLIKAGLAVASTPVKAAARKRLRRRQVSWAVARAAKNNSIRLKSAAVRNWLKRPDVQEQLQRGTSSTLTTAVGSLAWLLPGDEQQRARDAQTVLFLVLTEFLRAQKPSTATALAYEWQVEHIRTEGRTTRETVQVAERAILDRFNASETFPDSVRALHPWRRDQALRIRNAWRPIEHVVDAITGSLDRGALLEQWADQPPDWFTEAPSEVACWLGELAGDAGQSTAAANFFAAAIDRGASPRSYWVTRRASHLLETDAKSVEALHLLESAADEHPLAACVHAWHRQEFREAIDALSAWTPTSAQDRARKLQILARLSVGSGDLNGGVTHALQAAEIEGATAAAILAAELLLTRSRYGETVHRLADAERATALALRARNARRTWGADSVAAALVAVKAAGIAGNPARAWAITQSPPDGEASDAEAADPRLRREAAVLAALTGRFDQAHEAADASGDAFTKAEVKALELSDQGEQAGAIAAWQNAFSVAKAGADRLAAAMGLAELGAPLPDLGGLERTHPDAVRDIRLVHEAMAADEDLETLRAGAAQNPILTVKLAERHGECGEPQTAAEVLEAGAERWTDPRMMLMAARRYYEAGDPDAARGAANSALALGGPGWAGEFDARALLLSIHDGTGDWEKATQQARALVALDPHDPNARWALVLCLVRRGDLTAAWNALTPEGDPIPPRDRQDALTWINLAARYDASPQFLPRALATMSQWSDDEQLSGIFIAQIYSGLLREGLTPTEKDIEALHAATAEYTARFPDSKVFRSIPVPDDDPLGPITAELQKRPEAIDDLFAQVREGRLPLALLAEVSGRSYAEAALRRAAGLVRCHDPTRAEGRRVVSEALDRSVVIDTTAAHTLTLLDQSIRSRLFTVFGQVLTTDPAYRDALQGQESLALQSTMSVGWDAAANQPSIDVIDEEVASELAERADRLCEILRSAVRKPWPGLKALHDLPRDLDCLASLDMAAAEGRAFWCDDAVLRALASSQGVAAFDTVDLLRHLATEGRLQVDLLTVSEATLLRNYYVDLEFDRTAYDFAATMDQWRPRGAAFAITRPAAWTDPPSVIDFMFSAVQQRADVALEDIEGWITAAALGLVRIAPNAQAAGANLGLLLRQCLGRSWIRPDRLPVVLRAVRVGLQERPGITDPLEEVLRETYRSLVDQHGHGLAAPLLISLFQSSSEPDRLTAARVVLTHGI